MFRILMVEDEPLLVKAIKSKLNLNGFEVVAASDGLKALEALNSSIDLIWLDIYMPNMDGVEFLKRLSMIDEHKKTPVIIVSASMPKAQMSQMIFHDNVVKVFCKSETDLGEIVNWIGEYVVKAKQR